MTDGEPETAVSASLHKINLIKKQHNFFFSIFYFIKSQTSDSFVNHFNGHFAYLKTLDFSFNDVDLDAEQGWRQDAILQDPHLLLLQLRQRGTHSNLERLFRQEALNKPGEMASETKIPEVCQNAVLPCCVVVQKMVKTPKKMVKTCSFLTEVFLIKVSK